MFRRVLMAAVLVAATPFAACDAVEGPNCCALKRFCSVCTTCSSDKNAMATKGDEVACKVIVDEFKSMAQFCNPDDAPPKHSIDEFLLECE